jgi:long-chain acyl-CoA synthetase
VHGDAKPYLVALITLDPMGWRDWCTARGIEADTVADVIADQRVRAEVSRAVEEGNALLARVEQIKSWTLLDKLWDSESGELTPTMKLKRPVVRERYDAEIEDLYVSTPTGRVST